MWLNVMKEVSVHLQLEGRDPSTVIKHIWHTLLQGTRPSSPHMPKVRHNPTAGDPSTATQNPEHLPIKTWQWRCKMRWRGCSCMKPPHVPFIAGVEVLCHQEDRQRGAQEAGGLC